MNSAPGCRFAPPFVIIAVMGSWLVVSLPVAADHYSGSELSPDGASLLCRPDPRGLNQFTTKADPSRTPTGFLYDTPCIAPEHDPEGDGWIVFGAIEAGGSVSTGDDDNVYFVEYADREDGAIISLLSIEGQDRNSARYFRINGGVLGRDDQHIEAEYGVAGSYRIRGRYNEIPHTSATNARSIYQGVGTGTLSLPDAVPPGSVVGAGLDGGVATAALNDLIAAEEDFSLRVERRRSGLFGELELTDGLKARLDYQHEKRTGSKADAGSFLFDFIGLGGVTEIVQPVDYRGDELTTGLYYRGEGHNINVSYRLSGFENEIDSVTWENPWMTGFSYVPISGQTDLYADNNSRQFRIEGNYELPFWAGLATLSLSDTKMEQDDDMLPFTRNSGELVTFETSIDLQDWNTRSALPRRTANARLETRLEQFKLHFKPLRALALALHYRHYREDNQTDPFAACNALTDQCAFVLLDGGLAGLSGTATLFRLDDPVKGIFSNFHYRSVPWDHELDVIGAGADYRLAGKTTIGLAFERETVARSYREAKKTRENRFEGKLVHRDAGWGTLRLKLGFNDRDFDGRYQSNPYASFWTEQRWRELVADPLTAPDLAAVAQAALDNLPPHTLAQLRKSDVAAREQLDLAVKLNLVVNARSDLFISADYREDNFNESDFGLLEDRTVDFGVDFSRQFADTSSGYLSYHYQSLASVMANANEATVPSDLSPNFGEGYYIAGNNWRSREDEEGHYLSLGCSVELLPGYRIDAGYSYGLTETEIRYAGSTGATFYGIPSPMNRFDEIKYEQQVLQINLTRKLSSRLSWRLFMEYERGEVEDFHYQGIRFADAGKMLLGTAVEGWEAYTFGAFLQYRF